MLTEREVFQKAYALVSNPETWCKESYALNKYGESCDEDGAEACQWCSIGSLTRFVEWRDPAFDKIVSAFNMQRHEIEQFNDRHTHAEVVALWRNVGIANGWLDSEQP